MDTEIKIVVYGLLLQGLIFLVKTLVMSFKNRKKDVAEVEGIESKTANTDSETIQNYVEIVEKIRRQYEEQRVGNVERDKKIEQLSKSNKGLVNENKEMMNSIKNLEEENESLKKAVISGQVDKQWLIDGIQQLIEQMKEAGIIPAFTLEK